MILKFGNLSPAEFAARVGSEFTEGELAELKSVWSQGAKLRNADDFHIFDDPAISIHIGAADSRAVEIFKAANARNTFNREVTFYLDRDWEPARAR